MKNIKLIMCSSVLLASCASQSVQDTARLEESRQVAIQFMQTLGGQLKQQIKAGGIASAIPVCQQIAPATAAKFSNDQQTVKRVSTKARNTTQGIPDQWELAALNTFEEKIKRDPNLKQLDMGEVVEEGGQSYYRYAKAIRIKPVCLNCHGAEENIKTDVKAALTKHYPDDVATGYQLGELRGAISVKQRHTN